MSTRDYSSVYTIKEFILKNIAPKYFDMENTNLLNIGMVGFTTDVMATTTEDTFNSFSTYTKEIFPNLAEIPETIYNNAARFQIDNLLATPAQMEVMLFINEKDIISMGDKKGSIIEFVLDSELIIDIEGQQFMMDYDVQIQAKPYRGDYIFNAAYIMDFNNSLNSNPNPYIKHIRVPVAGQKYVALMITVRRVNKFIQIDEIINNDKVNLPTINFEFNDQLANFEIFYKAPGEDDYIQLKKRLMNSPPLKDPFCFYRIKDENKIEISFSVQEAYFQPEFNSEIMFHIYTTTGKDGNFPLYKGTDITVLTKSERYDYNNNLITFAAARTASTGGRDKLTLEELRSMIIELGSTSGAYTTENDLQLYFSNNTNVSRNDILFVKRRDDALERLFSAFSLFKDVNGDIYPTNTLNLAMVDGDFDSYYEQSNRFILKPGHVFRYKPNSLDQVEIIPDKSIMDDLSTIKEDFLYTNPFMITLSKTQGIVGFYLNSLNIQSPLDYKEFNSDSPVQFICNNVIVNRDALKGENKYRLTLHLSPTTTEELPIVNPDGTPTGNLMIKGFVEDIGSVETAFIDFEFSSYDKGTNTYTFVAEMETDDYMTNQERLRILNARNVETGVVEEKLIPMVDCVINFCAFYKSDVTNKLPHRYDYNTELEPFTMTNVYSCSIEPINFITPINMMRSRFKFINTGNSRYMLMSFIPFVKASTMKNDKLHQDFISSLYEQYGYLQNIIDRITNNFGIDMKFYNTYGKSKNFNIGENGALLDKVNCRIRYAIAPKVGVDENVIIGEIKRYIKSYIEEVNKDKGYNSIYISNQIQSILNTFESSISHLRFLGINNYDSLIQTIENRGINIEAMTKEERREYVPEYLTIGLDDIIIDIIVN